MSFDSLRLDCPTEEKIHLSSQYIASHVDSAHCKRILEIYFRECRFVQNSHYREQRVSE